MSDLPPLPRASLLKIPRQRRSQAMVHTIVDAAIRVLAERGHLGFTTHTVAAEAGISVGSLYQYFANKEMIVGAIVERGVLQAETMMAALFRKNVDRTPEQILHRAIKATTTVVAPYREAMVEILAAVPLLSETGVPALLRRPFLDIASEYFRQNADRYEIEGGQVAMTVAIDTLIYMMLRRWADPAPMISDAAYYDALVKLVTSPVRGRTG